MARILVIDDDAFVCTTIRRILGRAGHQVLTAPDGRRGLELFATERPDLVITDIIMPEMEGIEIIRAMKTGSPEAKIIAISGGGRLGSFDYLPMAAKLGASEIVAKPFEPMELIEVVSRFLDAAGAAEARCPEAPAD